MKVTAWLRWDTEPSGPLLGVVLLLSCASNEAGLAQEIREISFEHLLLNTISVAMATGQVLPVLLHLECTVPASLLSSPSPPKGCPQTRCNTIIRVREREDLLLASPSTSIACLLQVIFHTIYTSNTPMCPVQLCYAVL